jgi:membrane protein DedA with SNARE-associated domain
LFLVVENLIREYGLIAVVLGAMFEGEMTLLFAGVLAHYGLFSFAEVFLSGALGGFVGDTIGWLFGFYGKKSISKSAFIQKAEPKLQKLSQRFGIYSIFLVKYIYGLRSASAIFWGFAPMRFARFGPLTLASCMVWAGLLSGIGFFFSEAIELIIGRVQQIGFILLIAAFIAVIIAYLVYLIERNLIGSKIPEIGILGLKEPPLLRHQKKTEETELMKAARQARELSRRSRAA